MTFESVDKITVENASKERTRVSGRPLGPLTDVRLFPGWVRVAGNTLGNEIMAGIEQEDWGKHEPSAGRVSSREHGLRSCLRRTPAVLPERTVDSRSQPRPAPTTFPVECF